MRRAVAVGDADVEHRIPTALPEAPARRIAATSVCFWGRGGLLLLLLLLLHRLLLPLAPALRPLLPRWRRWLLRLALRLRLLGLLLLRRRPLLLLLSLALLRALLLPSRQRRGRRYQLLLLLLRSGAALSSRAPGLEDVGPCCRCPFLV